MPYGGGSYNAEGGGGITPAPIFTGATTEAPKANSKYTNPNTGLEMSPTEYANYMVSKLPKGSGDIGNYAGDAATNPNQTANELRGRATDLNNARNDIAVGATDPYKVGNQSGIAYSPAELKAIENAYAGIYDPALKEVFSRLEDKKAADAEILAREQMLEEKKIDHDYRMSERVAPAAPKGPTSYQEWTLAGGEEGTGKSYYQYLQSAGGGEGGFKSEVATNGREAVTNMLTIANNSPGIFGRTAASTTIPDSFRSDDFRNYKAQLDALKGNIIPAALTAMREASKTGGALGQVSDREGAWLAASLGALEMSQSSDQIIKQLNQIDAHLKSWQDAVAEYEGAQPSANTQDLPDTMILNGQTLYLQNDGTYE